MSFKRLPNDDDDDLRDDDLLTVALNHPWSHVLQRAALWTLAQVMVAYTLFWLFVLLLSLIDVSAPYIPLLTWVVAAGVGWLVAAIQQTLADTIFDLTLPRWRLIGLVSGVLAGGAVAAPAMPALDAVPFAVVAGAPFVVLLVMTALQMWALRAVSARAWLWALPMPLAGWLVTGRAFDPEPLIGLGCGAMTIFALYHLAGGITLGLFAQHAD